ncbi:MAG: DUF420 domain-containing protein [Bernardetiaceae bacterium]
MYSSVNPSFLLKPLAHRRVVQVLAIVIPIAVAILIGIRERVPLGDWTKQLPHLIGAINAATSLLLVAAVVAIKQKKVVLHQNLMTAAFSLGAVFLLTYILYHVSNENTPYCGEGNIRFVYFFLLISHIVLSIGVVYFVLMAMHYSVTRQFDRHKKVVKIAFPVWLYVSVTGVIVYLMIVPCYG